MIDKHNVNLYLLFLIMRDVNGGWFLRYLHANAASFFFLFLYFHIAKGLYYSSYKSPRALVWSIGVIMLVLTMAIGFLGYSNSLTQFNDYNLYNFRLKFREFFLPFAMSFSYF